MARNDIGVDLGTATTIIHIHKKGIVLEEPSIVALDARSGKVISVGKDAYTMLGKTPDSMRVIHPLENGVISDYEVTGEMIKYFIKKLNSGSVFKPRVCVCVPSGVTDVESRAVIDTVISAGARKVFLIEEPVAAALGAGIDITPPGGHIIVDIGGGTSDIAVLSLSGVVCKSSVRVAGNKLTRSIIKYISDKYNVLIGMTTAELTKMAIGSVWPEEEVREYEVKGRNLYSGLPQRLVITNQELVEPITAQAEQIVDALKGVLERTPPELVADLQMRGVIMTGGGAMIKGLDKLIEDRTRLKAKLAPNPVQCVALGVGKSFEYLDKFADGFVNHTNRFSD